MKDAAVPAEVQQGACGGGDSLSWPAEEVELREGARLLRLHVLQVEAAHQEVVAPDVLRHQVHLHADTGEHSKRVPIQRRAGAHLVDVVEGGAFVGPVAVTLLLSVLHQGGHHHDHGAAVLPNHLRHNRFHLDPRTFRTAKLSPSDVSADLPEVRDGVRQRALGGDVGRHPGVMLDLTGNDHI